MMRDRKQFFTPIQGAHFQASQYLERDDFPNAPQSS